MELHLARIPAADEALRPAVRAFLAEQLADMPDDRRARSWLGFDLGFSRALAQRGWIGLTLPTEFGGGGRSHFARFVLMEELLNLGAPVAAHWISERQSGPLLLKYGSEEQRRRLVPMICRAEAVFCVGMSEPEAGSDLSAVRTRAVRTSNGWRLNGAKLWTTNGHRADFMIALVRTSDHEDRHAGLSQVLVDMSSKGVSVTPIHDLVGDAHFAEVRFDDVELPADALIGDEGSGWEQVNAELAFERSGPERYLSCMVLMDGWLDFVRARGAKDSEAELTGRLLSQLATLRELSLSVTSELAAGRSPMLEASMVKDLGTTFEQSIPNAIADQLAAYPPDDVPHALLAALDYLTAVSPSFSLRGGTREVLRGIVARRLGLR